MTTTHEAIPTAWTAQDEDFFRVVSTLLSAGFLEGASALLASNDVDAVAENNPAAAPAVSSAAASPVPAEPAAAADRPLAA
jgi:hypothetical protein